MPIIFIACVIRDIDLPNLSLRVEQYNKIEKCFVGGGKTAAGTNRSVTISPKIQPLIDDIIGERTSGAIFCKDDGTQMSYKDFRDNYFL